MQTCNRVLKISAPALMLVSSVLLTLGQTWGQESQDPPCDVGSYKMWLKRYSADWLTMTYQQYCIKRNSPECGDWIYGPKIDHMKFRNRKLGEFKTGMTKKQCETIAKEFCEGAKGYGDDNCSPP